MGFSFKPDEAADAALRRLAIRQIDSAIAALGAEGETVHAGIHDARKRFKQVRAVLRLARDELGKGYAETNARFRDYGRRLSAARDAQVMLDTLDKLTGSQPERLRETQAVRDVLTARREKLAEQELAESDVRAEIAAELRAERVRIADWPLRRKRFGAVAPGLGRIYRRGRGAMKQAYRSGDDGDFHEWRKQAKYHWYHVRLLKPLWPPVLKAHAGELKRLADCLGDDHDLAVLRATLCADPASMGGDEAIRPALELAAERQRALREQARGLGERLYAESGGDLIDRLAAYHDAWRRSRR